MGHNLEEKQYLDLLIDLIDNGVYKEPARENLSRTKALFVRSMRFNMQNGFPLLTTKKLFVKGMIAELLWFLKGDTNISYLNQNGVTKFWHEDCYKYWLKLFKANPVNKGNEPLSFDDWCLAINDEKLAMSFGDCGKIYGYQWRQFCGHFDQVADVIRRVLHSPADRYKVVTAWNPTDTINQALPACHMLWQLNCRPLSLKERVQYAIDNCISLTNDTNVDNSVIAEDIDMYIECGIELMETACDNANIPTQTIDLALTQRSCDTCLGVPINIASYALLLHIIAKLTNCMPGEFIWTGNDVHIYEHHIENAQIQALREPFEFPTLSIDDSKWYKPTAEKWKTQPSIALNEVLDTINISDFSFVDYNHHDAIEYKLCTGLFNVSKTK